MRALVIVLLLTSLNMSRRSQAQAPEVIQRLQQYAGMSPESAVVTVRAVNEILSANARRGGEAYDPLRQHMNRAAFGATAGPGQTRSEYDQRLAYVLSRMMAGLDEASLAVIFAPSPNAAVMCTSQYGLTMGQCDALVAAASRRSLRVPYTPPNDGRQLAVTLEAEGVQRGAADEIARALYPVMMGIPRNLTRDQRGMGLIELMEACPGGIDDREGQVRAWHLGPTVEMGRCLAAVLSRTGGAAAARTRFTLSARAARAFVDWAERGSEQAAGTVAPSASPAQASVPAGVLRDRGNQLFGAGRYQEAAALFQQAAAQEPQHAPTFMAIGNCFVRLGRFTDAVAAFRHAISIDGQEAGHYVGLAQAYLAAGDRQGAATALQQGYAVAPAHGGVLDGMRALGISPPPAAPPPPPPPPPPPANPRVPSRDQVMAAMRPLNEALEGCAPSFGGVVIFRVHVLGETGEVARARLLRGEVGDTAERACMEGVVQSAIFPRFERRQFSVDYPFELGSVPE